jgi:hypothetical protein
MKTNRELKKSRHLLETPISLGPSESFFPLTVVCTRPCVICLSSDVDAGRTLKTDYRMKEGKNFPFFPDAFFRKEHA